MPIIGPRFRASSRLLCIGALTLALSSCSWPLIFAKESVVAASSHRGWDTFTFKGQLPAEFGIDAFALYGPEDPNGVGCQSPTFEPGKTITRRHSQQYTADIQAQPQDFSFEIPLSYYKGLCGMKLGRLKLEINGRYGAQKWQQAYGRGGFYIEENPSTTTSYFDDANMLTLTTTCTWWFQQSRARSRLGEIEKMLNCRGAGADLLRKKLKDQTITLEVKVNSAEEPSHDDTWIKFPAGWKPCAVKNGWRWCRQPFEFQTFKMNGQICTVYPNCKEQ